jgi:predicted phosphodiesterase
VTAASVAALYDIHGNLPALEAVLADPRLESAEVVVVGGDVIAGPFPAECLQLLGLLGERARYIRGNADREVVEGIDAPQNRPDRRFVADRLSAGQVAAIAAWPLTVEVEITGIGRVVFCHATPRADFPIVTRLTPEEDILDTFGPITADLIVCGHTHMQFDRPVGRYRLVNAGSVGAPYEDAVGAYWAMLGREVDLLRTDYDTGAALRAIEGSGYPDVSDWLGPVLRGEHTAAEALLVFEDRRLAETP